MKFVAVITDRSFGDYNGVGWKAEPIAKEFLGDTKIEDIWVWVLETMSKGGGGILQIMELK